MEPGSLELLYNAGYAVVSVLIVVTIYLLVAPMLEGDRLKKRIESVADAREGMRKNRMAELESKQASLRQESKGVSRNLVDRLSLAKLLEATDLKDKLAQAGMRGQSPVYKFYMFRMFLPLGLGGMGLVFFLILNVGDWALLQRTAATLGLTMFGYYLPGLYISNKAKKRLASIMEVFPDALDLLLICVESGMSIEMAFSRVADELAENSIELAEEFSLTNAELSYLSSRRQAYENLARRNQHQGIQSVSTSLIQAERYGTPLGESLRTMANENRQLRMLQAEKKAAALPAKLTVPMILFFLPVLMVVILTPAAMRLGAALT